MKKIIGICGKAGSGKDTVSDIIVNDYNYCKIALADPIKRFLKEIFEFSDEQLWGSSEKRSEPDSRYLRYLKDHTHLIDNKLASKYPSGMVPEYLSPRYALQQIGTEGARHCYADVWIEYAIKKINLLLSSDIYRYDKNKGVYSVLGTGYEDKIPVPQGVIISDCRFINEIQNIKKAGGIVIKVKRDNAGLKGSEAQHQSEIEQDFIPEEEFTHIIDNNSTLEDLNKEILKII